MRQSILVAGIGNIFHGDDAFGSEVARRLAEAPLPPDVRVVDFGIRGHDLAFALQGGYAIAILIDIVQRGQAPGTLSVIEPDLNALQDDGKGGGIDTHAMDPLRVLRWLHNHGNPLPRLWLVGCEPGIFGSEEGHMGLSEPVAAAIPVAMELVLSVIRDPGVRS
jgi:hydrogenase maturation protease